MENKGVLTKREFCKVCGKDLELGEKQCVGCGSIVQSFHKSLGSSSHQQASRSFLYVWGSKTLPKKIPLHAPAICATCGSPEANYEDRVYHRNITYPHIEWASHLLVHVCARHRGTWKQRIWSAFFTGITSLTFVIYFYLVLQIVAYILMPVAIAIPLILVYWHDPAARALYVESFSGVFFIQTSNLEWANIFLQYNSTELQEVSDLLMEFRRKRKLIFLSGISIIFGFCISLAIILPLWHLPDGTSELLKHPEFLVGITGLLICAIIMLVILAGGQDWLRREKEKAFQRVIKSPTHY